MGAFRRERSGVTLRLEPEQAGLLRELLGQLLELLGDPEPSSTDPLAAAVGIGTATAPPQDPALARLLPDAYTDDPAAASDFRRYTEPDLRRSKREAAQRALATLPATRKRRLGEEEAQAWLRALNDLRLALGTRLGVSEDLDRMLADLPEDDPRLYSFAVYDHLTYLQESLVQALMKG